VIIDVNVHLGRWPFRRLRGDDAHDLAALLRSKGVRQAWAGTFDGAFHYDLAAANGRLADDCRRDGEGLLVPFGAVDPAQPDWEEDLRRCHEVHGMKGIRLYPGYHGYALDDPRFADLLRRATERRLIVQLALKLEDARTQHRLGRVPTADVAPLPGLLPRFPGLRLVLLNALTDVPSPMLERLSSLGNVWFEISTLETLGGLEVLCRRVRTDRILFGSQAPFFTWDAARLKVKESGLDAPTERAVLEDNARALLGG
jgi:predicted TIM-barrel fold metal-dependent hydrolase